MEAISSASWASWVNCVTTRDPLLYDAARIAL